MTHSTTSARCLAALVAVTLGCAAALVSACGTRTGPLVRVARAVDASVDATVDLGRDGGRDLGADLSTIVTPCEADRACGAGTVCRAPASLAAVDLAPLALFCEPRTPARANDGERCDGRDSSACGRGLCVVAGTCVVPCASIDDCGDGERCAEVYVRSSVSALQPMRACTRIVVAPPDVTARVSLGAATSPGDFLPFGASIDHAARTTLALFTTQSGGQLLIESLSDSSGSVVFDLASLGPDLPPPLNPVNPASEALTVLLPSGAELARGAYRVDLLGENRGPIDLVELQRNGFGTVLDLDLYFVAGRLGGSAAAPISPELQRALDRFSEFYARLGILIGEVRTHELVGGLARGFASLEMDVTGNLPETAALFALTAGAPSASVSWFFVRDAEGVLGIAGGVPGAQCLPGTAASGIVISSDLMGSGVALESVLIHETGHFLGLFHTSESDGTILDPFDDTPACGLDRDLDFDGFLLPSECVGAGADNIMFWAATEAATISDSQAALVSGALLLR